MRFPKQRPYYPPTLGACWMVAEGGEGENSPKTWGVVFVGKRPQAPGEPGPKPWGPGPQAPWRPGPQASGAWIPPLSPPNFMGPGLKTLGCYHNPQSADFGGRWMVRAQGCGDLALKPLSPASRQPSRVKNSKNAPVLIGS